MLEGNSKTQGDKFFRGESVDEIVNYIEGKAQARKLGTIEEPFSQNQKLTKKQRKKLRALQQ